VNFVLTHHVDPDLIIVIVLLFLSGFFSASETALMTVTPAKVRTLVEAKKPGSKYLAKLKQNHHKTLITILVGNNFVNIAAASLTTVVMTEYFDSAAVGIATGVLTLVILIFGEVVPKSLATTYAKQLSLFVAPILFYLGLILTPIIWVLDGLVRILLKLMGSPDEMQVTDEELIAMASIGEEEGTIDEHERELIENVLEFNDIHAEEIMTPRVHIAAMPEDHSLSDATEYVLNHPYSRIPVYRETIDNIVGILSLKDLLKAVHEEADEESTLRQLDLQTPLKVRHTLKVQDLFRRFKNKRTHLAIVLDEHGGTAGLITMEDLLEELVGEIEDEQDENKEWVKEIKDGLYEVNGRLELDDLKDITGLEFDLPGYKSISFLVVEELGSLPRKGQKVVIDGWEFKITQMLRHTILKIELKKL
jgi:putative hemolysin